MNEVTPTTAIAIYQNSEFGQIRTLTINGEPWFVGKDVAEILGYERGTKTVVDHVDEEDRKMIDNKTQSYFGIELGQRGGWLINESGLYSLILSSKLPMARQFKRWITAEVLPAIRKTGSYGINVDELLDKISTLEEELDITHRLMLYTARSLPQPPDYRLYYNNVIAPLLNKIAEYVGKKTHKEILAYIYDNMTQHGGFDRVFAMNRLKSKYPYYYTGETQPSIIDSIIEFPDYYQIFMKTYARIEKSYSDNAKSSRLNIKEPDKMQIAINPLIEKLNDHSAHGMKTYGIIYDMMGSKTSWMCLMRRMRVKTKKDVILARPDKYELFCTCIAQMMQETI